MLFYQAALKKAADWALMFLPFLRSPATDFRRFTLERKTSPGPLPSETVMLVERIVIGISAHSVHCVVCGEMSSLNI